MSVVPFKIVRVFISSTFRDMQAERDHLVRFVFPKLRERLLLQRIHLVDVDLRWGVTSDQNAVDVCRNVIDECRPRFLCLLGGRYGWIPPQKTQSITADEVHYGALQSQRKSIAFFYFRDPAATEAMREHTPGEYREQKGTIGEKALVALKSSIEAAGFKPFTYGAHWDDDTKRLIGLEALGERVFDDLLQSITEEFGDTPAQGFDAFADENAAVEAFIDQNLTHFVLGGREATERQLLGYAKGDGEDYLCLIGEPGSGKSTLLAHVGRQLSQDSTLILASNFVGAGQNSADVQFTLRRLCHELGTREDIEPSRLGEVFAKALKDASEKARVVIVLDAINGFAKNDNFPSLSWLPSKLPPNCRIIMSTTPGKTPAELREHKLPVHELTLERLAESDQTIIIAQFLFRFGKRMTDAQQSALLSKTDADLPLYLLAALEELRTLGAYEEISRRIEDLPATALDLFKWIFKRLEDDQGFRNSVGTTIGPLLVRNVIASIAASRRGVSERELRELLKLVLPNEGDKQGNLAVLLLLLRPYLIQRNEQIDFYHDQVKNAAQTLYLGTQTEEAAAHQLLARLFLAELMASADRSRAGYEVLYHMRLAGMWNELIACLNNPEDFDRLAPRTYGVDFDASISTFTEVDDDSLTPKLLKTLPAPFRSRIAEALANIFIARAIEKIRLTQTFKQPWHETCQKLRDTDPEGFLRYRDAFYLFIRFAGVAFSYAVVACEKSSERARKFLDGDGGSSSFLEYLERFGSGQTGLSHSIEDHATEARYGVAELVRIRDGNAAEALATQ